MNMKFKQTLPLILILVLGSSCLLLPIPQSSNDGAAIDNLLNRIAVGSTTKDEVISALGKPNYSREENIMYWNKHYRGGTKVIFLSTQSKKIGNTPSTLMDLIFEFDSHGMLTRYYTFFNPSILYGDRYSDNKKACRRDCNMAASACVDSWHEDSYNALLCNKVFLEQRGCLKQCDYDVAVPSYDSKNDSGQVCRLDCYESEKACIDSINEGEDTSKGTLRCEKEKHLCFQQCVPITGMHGDCDPGMESCI